jgi:hypothetical protein
MTSIIWVLLVLIALKSIIFGQYWPWQYRNGVCPHCGNRTSAHGAPEGKEK